MCKFLIEDIKTDIKLNTLFNSHLFSSFYVHSCDTQTHTRARTHLRIHTSFHKKRLSIILSSLGGQGNVVFMGNWPYQLETLKQCKHSARHITLLVFRRLTYIDTTTPGQRSNFSLTYSLFFKSRHLLVISLIFSSHTCWQGICDGLN